MAAARAACALLDVMSCNWGALITARQAASCAVIKNRLLKRIYGPLKKNQTTDYTDCTDGKGEQWTQLGFEPSPSFSYQDV
jgi:hypothetical protein